MTSYKFYREWNGDDLYLELHDHHTLWKIHEKFNENRYYDEVDIAIMEIEQHFKNLKIFCLGRSGRHVCVEDTPINRRRYNHLVTYAEKLEQEIIDYFNNEHKGE